jgi:hypothetical protein
MDWQGLLTWKALTGFRMPHRMYVWELSELHQFLAFTWKPTNFSTLEESEISTSMYCEAEIKSWFSLSAKLHGSDAKPNIVPTHGLRLGQARSESGVNLNCIAQRLIPSTPPWLFRTPGFDYTLYNVGTKSNTSPDLYLSL